MTVELEKEELKMVIHPLQGDGAKLSLSTFSNSLEDIKKVASKFDCMDLQIINLSSNSPISMVITNASEEGRTSPTGSLDDLFSGLYNFLIEREIPISWPRSTIDAVRELLSPIGKSIGKFSLFTEKKTELTLDLEYKIAFENKIEDDFFSMGGVDGMLEAVNIHGQKNLLMLYPTIGKDKVSCEFDASLLEQVRNAIGSYVEIKGELKYRWRDKFPYHVLINKIEIVDEEKLTPFSKLFGMAPNATNGVASEEFVARLRSEQ